MTSPAADRPRIHRTLWRPAILDLYLLRLLAAPAVGVLAITLVAFLLDQTLRLINQLAQNGAHLGYLFGLVVNLVPYQLGLALPASFCIAMFIVIARLSDESELDAILAGGVSFERILAPLVLMGVILGAASLLLVGYLQPYARYGYRAVLNAANEAGWTARLDPRVFMSAGPDFTITADDADASGRNLKGVFIRRRSEEGDAIITASAGALALRADGNTTDVNLKGGLILLDAPSGARLLRFGDFSDHRTLKTGVSLTPRGGDEQELTLSELVRELGRSDAMIPKRVLRAELYSRLARSLAVPFLPLLALPLAMSVKRGRRAPSMIFGAVVLVAFHHGLSLCKSLSATGRVDPLWAIGGLFLAQAALGIWLFMSSRKRPGETPLSGLFARAEAVFDRRPRVPDTLAPSTGRVSLSAYLTRILAVRTAAAALALMTLLQLIDLLDRTGDILARGGALGIVRYMALRLPFLFQQVAPFAVLAGAVLTFIQLSRSSELVIMRVSGLSLFQIFRRALPVALVVAALDLAVTDQITPRSEQALATWWAASAPAAAVKTPPPRWFRIDRDLVEAKSASPDGKILHSVSIYRRDAHQALIERLTARQARWTGRGWRLKDGVITDIHDANAQTMTVEAADWPTTLTPGDTARLFSGAYQITSGAAYRSLFGKGAIDKSPSEARTRLYRTLAQGMAPIIMLLLAMPTALGHARVSGATPIIFGLGCGLLYLVIDGLLTAMGQAGVIPAFAAAWGAPVAFAAGALSLLLYAEG